MARVPKDIVHLVGIKVGRDYDPPPFPRSETSDMLP